ncbi:unnamed protein product [Mycena citricolor]|uniref:Uncharacterized protein n=1 Tax=Mycena citricolor TaxID=2018698 RepID=A0AAD2K5V5_9AGAR|nr:unnamed protein product [Mycena citricolor]
MRQALTRGPSSSDSSVDDDGSHTDALDTAATHYAGPQKGKYRITREFRKRFTLRGVVDRLLRKTVRKNTWIYVSDKHFNIFIGIKKTGTFQHSSLLGGGVVTSAGLITVKQGIVYKLSPLSGHYRTSISVSLLPPVRSRFIGDSISSILLMCSGIEAWTCTRPESVEQ